MVDLLFPIALFAIMYFGFLLPQQRKRKAQQQLMSSLAVGDGIVTGSGIYGEITEIEDDDLFVEIAPKIEIRVRRAAVAERLTDSAVEEQE